MQKITKTVDEYLEQQEKTIRRTLGEVRKAVVSAAPKAEETISYRVPYYKFLGACLAFMSNKNHCSFVTMSYDVIKQLKNELKGYKISGTTIHFPHDKPLPSTLVKKIVRIRMKENKEKAKIKLKSRHQK